MNRKSDVARCLAIVSLLLGLGVAAAADETVEFKVDCWSGGPCLMDTYEVEFYVKPLCWGPWFSDDFERFRWSTGGAGFATSCPVTGSLPDGAMITAVEWVPFGLVRGNSPVPGPWNEPEELHLSINGADFAPWPTSVSQTGHDESLYCGVTVDGGFMSALGNGCDEPSWWAKLDTPKGFPAWSNNGTNVVTLSSPGMASGGAQLDLFSLRLRLTYRNALFLDVDGQFDVANPVDDLPDFVPGSLLIGPSLSPGALPQVVRVIAVPPAGVSGSVSFQISNPSNYPGKAMNYPISGALTGPDMYFKDSKGKVTLGPVTAKIANGQAIATLYVDDYAASATVEATIPTGRNSTPLQASVQIPQDANGNNVPDAGWFALADSETGATTPIADPLDPGADSDPYPLVSGVPQEGITGDGLTSFEEYRGFVVRGAHRRLNPQYKDLFVLVDDTNPVDEALDDRMVELPVTLHEIRPPEAKGLMAPEINPNRGSIPAATLQRGVRMRDRWPSPEILLANGDLIPAHIKAKGIAHQIGDNLDTILLEELTRPVVSPNETQVVETFRSAFLENYIYYGPTPDTWLAPTDVVYPVEMCIYGGNDSLQSIPNSKNPSGDDYCTSIIFTACGIGGSRPFRALTELENWDLYQNVMLHEIAHAIDIEHDLTYCSPSIMATENADPPKRFLTAGDKAQIRIHRKH